MRIDRFIRNNTSHNQKSVRYLLAAKSIKADDAVITDQQFAINQFTKIELDGIVLQNKAPRYFMLHKPQGYLSATKDDKHPTVFKLIDEPDKHDLHIGGRLDFNTTGLMLITNDGTWSKNITEPSAKKPKTYLVTTEQKISKDYADKFAEGVYFTREKMTTQPAQLELLSDYQARLTIYEGKYHQVKRMFGYFDNKVTGLHRESMGDIHLDETLQPGEYRPLSRQEITSIETF